MDDNLAKIISSPDFITRTAEDRRELIDKALYSWQRQEFWQQHNILAKHGFVINTSDGGAGKTLMGGFEARLQNKPIVLFTMPTPLIAWDSDMPRIGVNIKLRMTFPTLKGKLVCNHGLLTRTPENDYVATDALRELFREKPIVIYDEVHYARNKDALLNKALSTVSRTARECGCQLIIISATPSHNQGDAVSYVKLFALCSEGEMLGLDRTTRQYLPLALRPFLEYCRKIDEVKTLAITKTPFTPVTLEAIIFALLTKVLIPEIYVRVTPETPPCHKESKYYKLPPGPHAIVKAAETHRSKTIGAAMNHGGSKIDIFRADNKYDQVVEPIVAEYGFVVDILAIDLRDPNAKSVIILKFHESMAHTKALLEATFPGKIAIMDGDTSVEMRNRLSTLYREDSDVLKIIITSKDVGGMSISLDDRKGNRERYLFKRADRTTVGNVQIDWRTSRGTSKSQTFIINGLVDGIKLERDRRDKDSVKEKDLNRYRGPVRTHTTDTIRLA